MFLFCFNKKRKNFLLDRKTHISGTKQSFDLSAELLTLRVFL